MNGATPSQEERIPRLWIRLPLVLALALTTSLLGAAPAAARWRSATARELDRHASDPAPGFRASAETRPGPRAAIAPPLDSPAPLVWLVAVSAGATVVGALAGLKGGFMLDYLLATPGPVPHGAVAGWYFGPVLTTPAAVHLANGLGGEFGASLAMSALIGVAGLVTARNSENWLRIAFGAQIVHAASAVVVERLTSDQGS